MCINCNDWYDWFTRLFDIAAFNPLNVKKIFEFSKTIQSLKLVIVVVVCNCFSYVMSVGGALDLLVSVDCYDWMGWSHWGLSCLLFSLRVVFYNV